MWRRLRFEEKAPCREALFNRFVPLARAIAKGERRKRPRHGLDAGEYLQLAYGGLLEAIDAFDPLRGIPFEVFARRRIKGAIADGAAKANEASAQHAFRRRLEKERLTSLCAEEHAADADHIALLAELAATLAIGMLAESAKLESAHASPYQSAPWRDLEARVLLEIEHLPDVEKSIMRQHYLNDVPFSQIALLLGLSKGRISQLHRAALQRLRGRLNTSG